jgi:hypothetical protein
MCKCAGNNYTYFVDTDQCETDTVSENPLVILDHPLIFVSFSVFPL